MATARNGKPEVGTLPSELPGRSDVDAFRGQFDDEVEAALATDGPEDDADGPNFRKADGTEELNALYLGISTLQLEIDQYVYI
jgi:hypothetical protein